MSDDNDECRIAYDPHLWPGRKCSRKGGSARCGKCLGDLAPEHQAQLTRNGCFERDVRRALDRLEKKTWAAVILGQLCSHRRLTKRCTICNPK